MPFEVDGIDAAPALSLNAECQQKKRKSLIADVFGLQIEDIALEIINFLQQWQTRGFTVVELRH